MNARTASAVGDVGIIEWLARFIGLMPDPDDSANVRGQGLDWTPIDQEHVDRLIAGIDRVLARPWMERSMGLYQLAVLPVSNATHNGTPYDCMILEPGAWPAIVEHLTSKGVRYSFQRTTGYSLTGPRHASPQRDTYGRAEICGFQKIHLSRDTSPNAEMIRPTVVAGSAQSMSLSALTAEEAVRFGHAMDGRRRELIDEACASMLAEPNDYTISETVGGYRFILRRNPRVNFDLGHADIAAEIAKRYPALFLSDAT